MDIYAENQKRAKEAAPGMRRSNIHGRLPQVSMDDAWTASLIAKHHGAGAGGEDLDVRVVHSQSDWTGYGAGASNSKGKGKKGGKKGEGKKGKGKGGKDKGGHESWDSWGGEYASWGDYGESSWSMSKDYSNSFLPNGG